MYRVLAGGCGEEPGTCVPSPVHSFFALRLAAVSVVVVVSNRALAEPFVFTIDPTQSTLQYSTVGGTYSTYAPSSPGSDTSSVSGHFLVSFRALLRGKALINVLSVAVKVIACSFQAREQ